MLTTEEIKHVAKLANLPLNPDQETVLAKQFAETVEFVDQLQKVDVKDVEPTSQVTGVANVWREDEIDSSRRLSQEEALRNAPRSHRGYFVVPKIFD